MTAAPGVRQLRLVLTTDDFDTAVRFFRDRLGMVEEGAYQDEGRIVILDAGRATLEIADEAHSAYVDRLEVGRRVAGAIRLALEVPDARAATAVAVEAGAELIAAPVRTPWESLNARLAAPGGLQLTLFEELNPGGG